MKAINLTEPYYWRVNKLWNAVEETTLHGIMSNIWFRELVLPISRFSIRPIDSAIADRLKDETNR